jgi:hypothetical protein
MIAPASDSFIVERVSWLARRDALHAVRRAVFIEEQRVPEHMEWDDEDEGSSKTVTSGAWPC